MLEKFLEASALPNLHPVLVHFPLALFPLAAGFDVLAVATARKWFDKVGIVLWGLGLALGYWAAEVGEDSAESFYDLPAAIEPEIAEHSDMAHYAIWVFAAVFVVRLYLLFHDRLAERLTTRGLRVGVLVLAAVGFFFLFETAEHGAALVYRHGLGVSADATMLVSAPVKETAEPARQAQLAPEADAGARLVRGDDGSLTWSPLAFDEDALGSIVFPVAGFPAGAVAVLPAATLDEGLELMVLDRSILVFAPAFGDVRVEAELVLDHFAGRAGVAHHVDSPEQASWFEVDTEGGVALRLTQGGSVLTLEDSAIAAGPIEPGQGSVRIAVSSAGKHIKGMVNGEVVAHGHIEPPADGKVGLLLDGKGRVRVKRVVVEPIGS